MDLSTREHNTPDRPLKRSRRALAAVALTAGLVLAGCGDDDDDAAPEITTTAEVADDDEFATLDANGDSSLDADEVAEHVDDVGLFDEWDVDADSELDADEVAGNAFELWDADEDGKVSEQEWESSTELWYPDDSTPTAIEDWDGDGDSELDADEFSERFDHSALGETWSVDSLDEETFKRAYFELYDVDDDGKVSSEEWRDGASAFGTPAE